MVEILMHSFDVPVLLSSIYLLIRIQRDASTCNYSILQPAASPVALVCLSGFRRSVVEVLVK
jgi:hypothetical protein